MCASCYLLCFCCAPVISSHHQVQARCILGYCRRVGKILLVSKWSSVNEKKGKNVSLCGQGLESVNIYVCTTTTIVIGMHKGICGSGVTKTVSDPGAEAFKCNPDLCCQYFVKLLLYRMRIHNHHSSLLLSPAQLCFFCLFVCFVTRGVNKFLAVCTRVIKILGLSL